MSAARSYVVLVSNAAQTCGVEAFARLLATRLGGASVSHVLGFDLGALATALRSADGLILNFPVVAWKRRLIEPLLAAKLARLMGKRVVVVLHEWADLDWKRRAALSPILPLANAILFSAPEIAEQFRTRSLSRISTRHRDIVPVPPNLVPPTKLVASENSRRLAEWRQAGRIAVGAFGSIYPKKQSTVLLDVIARLRARGIDAAAAFIGSFVAGGDMEARFSAHVGELGLADHVLITGYIATAAETFGVLREVSAFCYDFPEGLTTRRGSVLAASLSGRPVIVNAPPDRTALTHHPLFAALIGSAIVLVPPDADADALADAVMSSLAAAPTDPIDPLRLVDALWATIVARVDGRTGSIG